MTEYTTPPDDAQQEINDLLITVRSVADALSIIAGYAGDPRIEKNLHELSCELMEAGFNASVAMCMGERS